MSIYLHNRGGRWNFRDTALLACVLLGWTAAGVLRAQVPQPRQAVEPVAPREAPSGPRLYLNKSVIQLPIQISDQYRVQIREIQLYVKEQPTSPWTLRDRTGPDQKAFIFQAPRDGEYA